MVAVGFPKNESVLLYQRRLVPLAGSTLNPKPKPPNPKPQTPNPKP